MEVETGISNAITIAPLSLAESTPVIGGCLQAITMVRQAKIYPEIIEWRNGGGGGSPAIDVGNGNWGDIVFKVCPASPETRGESKEPDSPMQ